MAFCCIVMSLILFIIGFSVSSSQMLCNFKVDNCNYSVITLSYFCIIMAVVFHVCSIILATLERLSSVGPSPGAIHIWWTGAITFVFGLSLVTLFVISSMSFADGKYKISDNILFGAIWPSIIGFLLALVIFINYKINHHKNARKLSK